MGKQAAGPRPAGGPRGRQSPWRTTLLAAAILSSCFLPTQAQEIPVRTEPSQPLEGKDVTLTPGGEPDFLVCVWYRGEETEPSRIFTYSLINGLRNGPNFTERETRGPNCSLHIMPLMLNDTGNYVVTKIAASGGSEKGRAHIQVLENLTKPEVSTYPSPFPIELVGSLNLTCETTSREASVSWFYNGNPLTGSSRIQISEDNRTVVISDVNRNDTGEYQCEVTNPFSTNISDALYVAVIYGPDTPQIQPTEHSYDQHSEIRLSCHADAFPDPHYAWFLNGTELAKTSELRIPDAALEDSGSYVCQALNVLTRHASNTTLNIEVVGGNVSDVNITGPSTAIEYQTVTLNCTSLGSHVSYYWFKGNQQVEAGDRGIRLDNGILTLAPSIRTDSANYTCQGFNSFSSQFSDPHLLEIFYGPDSPLIDPQETVYNEGSTLNLSCFADSKPPANYSWWCNGEPLEDQKDSQLLIQNISLSSAGNYTCNATNDYTANFSSTSIEIIVQEKVSRVTFTSRPDKAIESQPFVLDCSSAGSNVSYVWSKGDQILESGGHITVVSKTLTFDPVSRSDTGNYTCSGHNSFSSSNATYLLDVFYGPDDPVISPPRHDYAESAPLRLSCHADSKPPAQYAWSFNETELNETSSQLSIPSLLFNDTGNYTCNASNPETGVFNSTTWEIRVLENVSDVIIQGPSETIEKELVTLGCISKGSEVQYTWFKEDQPLEAGDNISFQGPNRENLTFDRVNRSDTGSYTCLGNNSISESSSPPFRLDVFYGPDYISISPVGNYYPEGSDFNIFCQAHSNPVANYTWFFNKTKEVGNGSYLKIPNLSFNDTGDYTCNATNDKTNRFLSLVWEIQVLEKLFPPLLRPEEFFVKEHTNITLNCNTTQRSSVTVSWFKDGKPVPAKAVPSEQNRTLTVPDISKDDEGLYTCEAVNLANSARSNPSKVAVDSPAPAPPNTGLSPGAIVGIVIGCLLGVVLIVAVLYVAIKGTALGRMPPHSSNGNIPSAPGHNQGATDAKPAAGEEDIQYTTLAFNSNRPPQPSPGTTNPLESGTIYSVIKKK